MSTTTDPLYIRGSRASAEENDSSPERSRPGKDASRRASPSSREPDGRGSAQVAPHRRQRRRTGTWSRRPLPAPAVGSLQATRRLRDRPAPWRAQRLLAVFGAAECSQCNRRHVLAAVDGAETDVAQEGETILIGEPDVAQDQVERRRFNMPHRFAGGRGGEYCRRDEVRHQSAMFHCKHSSRFSGRNMSRM